MVGPDYWLQLLDKLNPNNSYTTFLLTAFTPTKDYSPKRQFENYSHSVSKTVSVETPTQHSIYNKRLIKPLLVVRVGPGTNPKYGSH